MGLGKLTFLEFVDEAVGGEARVSNESTFIRGDYFVCSRLGLGFVKPSAWHFRSFIDFAPYVARQSLNDLDDGSVEHEQAIQEYAGTVVAVVTKYPLAKEDGSVEQRFSPCITIAILGKGQCGEAGASLRSIVHRVIDACLERLPECRVTAPPVFQPLSGCHAASLTSQYMCVGEGIEPRLLRTRSLFVEHGARIYNIDLVDSPWAGEEVVSEFDAFLGSVHLA
jgi:hypothetical protein